jgi:hypothetical protein
VFVTSHVLAGATIGTLLSRCPTGAFVAGVVSHLGMDACPHWGVVPGVPGNDETFLRVARCDGCAGLAAMALCAGLVGPRARRATVAAMVGAALPDLDKPLLHFFGVNPFPLAFRHFHSRIQREAPHRVPHEVLAACVLATMAAGRMVATARPGGAHRSSD